MFSKVWYKVQSNEVNYMSQICLEFSFLTFLSVRVKKAPQAAIKETQCPLSSDDDLLQFSIFLGSQHMLKYWLILLNWKEKVEFVSLPPGQSRNINIAFAKKLIAG